MPRNPRRLASHGKTQGETGREQRVSWPNQSRLEQEPAYLHK